MSAVLRGRAGKTAISMIDGTEVSYESVRPHGPAKRLARNFPRRRTALSISPFLRASAPARQRRGRIEPGQGAITEGLLSAVPVDVVELDHDLHRMMRALAQPQFHVPQG